MSSFEPIYARAVQRHGQALALRLPEVRTPEELRATPDDRYLAQMAQGVFQAGFVWRVIQAKWPGFEEAFRGFDPQALLSMEAEEIAALRQDTRIVRNGQKIDATLKNALWVNHISEEYGGFGAFLAQWPQDDIIGLWSVLKEQGARLGGDTGPRFLRRSGVDTFVLSSDVKEALRGAGVEITKGSSKRDQRAAQAAFLEWREETGMPLAHLSVIAASSVGEIYGTV